MNGMGLQPLVAQAANHVGYELLPVLEVRETRC